MTTVHGSHHHWRAVWRSAEVPVWEVVAELVTHGRMAACICHAATNSRAMLAAAARYHEGC